LGDPSLRSLLSAEEAVLLEASSLAALGRSEEALESCAGAQSGALGELRATLLLRGGHWQAGRDAWRRLDRQTGVGDNALLAIARSYKAEGDTSAAVGAYEKLGERFPRWQPRVLWVSAWLEEARGHRHDALRYLDRLLQHPGAASLRNQALLHRTLLALDCGRSQEARRSAQELTRRAREGPLADSGRYWTWVAAGRPGEGPELRESSSAYRWFLASTPPLHLSARLLQRHRSAHAQMLAQMLKGDQEMRTALRAPLDTVTKLVAVGWLDWARAECRQAELLRPRSGAEVTQLATLALQAGAQDIYLRMVEPRLRGARCESRTKDLLLHPLRFLPEVQAALPADRDPLLACAIIEVESAGNPGAISPVGAIGLMQMLPRTANEVACDLGLPPPDPRTLRQPCTNIRLGCAYLESLLVRFEGREERAVAAYNAGPKAVERWERQNPGCDPVRFMDGAEFEETRSYLRRVLAIRQTLHHILEGIDGADIGSDQWRGVGSSLGLESAAPEVVSDV
jgi:soluble lytic murein transglycosylase-like protein